MQEAKSALRTAIEQAEKCQRDNPLGGPAKVFDAMANSIRAGDDYHQVLRQYGFVEAAEKQEPYGYVSTHTSGLMHFNKTFHGVYTDTATEIVAVYTHPAPAAQRQFVGLTDEEIKIIWSWEVGKAGYNSHELPWRYAHAIEAKLREKNGGQA